jgi:hypothetical protein
MIAYRAIREGFVMKDRMEEKPIEKVEPLSRFVTYKITHLLALSR